MEIGSVAEWATACAETAAVLVALFLPYVERRRADRKSTRNLKMMLLGIVNRALEQNDPKSLETFLSVSAFTDAAERDKDTLDVARQILELFKSGKADGDTSSRDKEIKALLQTIKP
ncbi:hypothetical protein [Bifidobacterium sp. ESL0790]|uniref:hypothetical protein n=1 Tax=Bifidobacterium sp. ESL0790 TaxID=2983233 RepID=UPI0023F6A002|nr:hypothetical protein [Bifidobacterium sp. ESL0790]WEV73075.1 hypothetical protein OZY47_03780 [Bifidobacterium sp. ESL0790]